MTSKTFRAATSVKTQFDLKGRVCLLTGGAGFLGGQFAEAIAEMGGVPILLDRSEEELAKTSERVISAFGRCETEIGNVADVDSLQSACKRVVGRHGKIDVLINNAALTKYGCDADPELFFSPFEKTDRTVWEQGLEVNLTGVMLSCQIFGSQMLSQGKGSIINIGSDVGIISPDQRIYEADDSGYQGVPFNTPAFYSVSKSGVIHLTKHLASLWGPYNVRVNTFSPSGVYRDHDPCFVEKLTSRIPMNRMGAVNEYKGAIIFLASDASSFMTGHNLVMDGGRTAW